MPERYEKCNRFAAVRGGQGRLRRLVACGYAVYVRAQLINEVSKTRAFEEMGDIAHSSCITCVLHTLQRNRARDAPSCKISCGGQRPTYLPTRL